MNDFLKNCIHSITDVDRKLLARNHANSNSWTNRFNRINETRFQNLDFFLKWQKMLKLWHQNEMYYCSKTTYDSGNEINLIIKS